LGGEVRAFLDLGCLSVGVDVNPPPKSKFVLYGDFQFLQFPDGCFNVVFTNSLDHVFDLDRFASEVRRVLKPCGWFIADVVDGEAEGRAGGEYEVLSWNTSSEVVSAITRRGFCLHKERRIVSPWSGVHAVFEKEVR
jgi:ubiquinone/menaquinone biosynthesis C-methylase UbiE